jgi:fructose-bisphosphate aldolase/6-deoxy-5-ketofructose 1-phosphate synthase
MDVNVPLLVPSEARETYIQNYCLITKNSGNLMLFAGDQKIEHLNDDFYGADIHSDDNNPEHLFRIAREADVGCLAVQLGLVSQYGADYPDITYLIKLNSKTHLVKTEQMDPCSCMITTVEDVVRVRDTGRLNIAGIGYTIYLGSEYESQMLVEASKVISEGQRYGLVTVLWIYPRGKGVKDEKDPHLIAGAAGVALALGADFVKVNPPKKEGANSAELLREAVHAAGRTKVVCAGGSSVDVNVFLQQLYDQIHVGGCAGNATGRNIHQKAREEAVRMCKAISAITIDNASVETALKIYHGN